MCNLNFIGSYQFVGLLNVLVHLLGPSGLVVALGAGLVRLAVVAILQMNINLNGVDYNKGPFYFGGIS